VLSAATSLANVGGARLRVQRYPSERVLPMHSQCCVTACWLIAGCLLPACWLLVGCLLAASWMLLGCLLALCWMRWLPVGCLLAACWLLAGAHQGHLGACIICYPKGCAATSCVQCQCNARGSLSKLAGVPPRRKINVTSKSPVGDISVVTLIRTDTTLDHSQKAEKVWNEPAVGTLL